MILFLNKMDMLKKKVEGGVFLIQDYFPEYQTYRPPQPDSSGEWVGHQLITINNHYYLTNREKRCGRF